MVAAFGLNHEDPHLIRQHIRWLPWAQTPEPRIVLLEDMQGEMAWYLAMYQCAMLDIFSEGRSRDPKKSNISGSRMLQIKIRTGERVFKDYYNRKGRYVRTVIQDEKITPFESAFLFLFSDYFEELSDSVGISASYVRKHLARKVYEHELEFRRNQNILLSDYNEAELKGAEKLAEDSLTPYQKALKEIYEKHPHL